jgi:hypothetical protein
MLHNFQSSGVTNNFGGATKSFIHPPTVTHWIWAEPENMRGKKRERKNYLERKQKYFSSIRT